MNRSTRLQISIEKMSKNQRYNDRDSYDDSRGDDSYSDYTS